MRVYIQEKKKIAVNETLAKVSENRMKASVPVCVRSRGSFTITQPNAYRKA